MAEPRSRLLIGSCGAIFLTSFPLVLMCSTKWLTQIIMYFFNKWCSCCNIFYFRIVETGYYSEHKAAEALRQICEALEVSVLNSLHWILCKSIAEDLGGKIWEWQVIYTVFIRHQRSENSLFTTQNSPPKGHRLWLFFTQMRILFKDILLECYTFLLVLEFSMKTL